jgi:hypothetical protein
MCDGKRKRKFQDAKIIDIKKPVPDFMIGTGKGELLMWSMIYLSVLAGYALSF